MRRCRQFYWIYRRVFTVKYYWQRLVRLRNNWEYCQNSAWLSENFGGRRSAAFRKAEALERVLDPPLLKFASWNQRACRAQVRRKIAGGIRRYANGPSGVVARRVMTPASETGEACSITSAEYLREIAIVSLLPRLAPFSLHSVV